VHFAKPFDQAAAVLFPNLELFLQSHLLKSSDAIRIKPALLSIRF
jgi:hypothetical protein